MTYVLAILGVVGLAQSLLIWRLLRSLRRIDGLEERVARCSQGLALLVETTESGFMMVSGELARFGSTRTRRPASASTTRRIARAAREGQRLSEIAASEEMSEGEVRLRLFMQDAAGRPDTHERVPMRA